MKQARPYPRAIVTRKAARSLAGGHPWVFEGEVLRLEPAPTDGRAAINGDVVDVFEENGTWQGAGLLSLESKIRVRIVTRNANDRVDEAFWRRRAQWAWAHRVSCMGTRALPGAAPDTRACRVIFSEADGFPGLVVDRYESVLVAQVGTVGMERLRDVVYPAVLDALAQAGERVDALFERNDSPARDKEGLPRRKGWWDGLPAPASSRVKVRENGLAFDVDIENSQKTGFFLDQKYNRRAVRELAAGRRVLDCFCHVGPFGLNAAAGGAELVRCVDVSQTALDLAAENARLNGLDGRVSFTCADVLDYLPELARDRSRLRAEGGPFDLIVLDPPAFTKSRGTVAHAQRGYREINYEALRLLPRGGYLATCSCSQHMTRDLLARAVAEAAHRANVQLKQVEERQQAPDHPILWGFPESHYLDFFVFQVV
ncbi:class I SAM-dependent rRNA methyltransferase [Thermophilibacter sp.]